MMYATIKMLIQCDEEAQQVLKKYERMYVEEVKRAAYYLKNKQQPLLYQNVSDMIHYRSKPAIIKEAKRLEKQVKINESHIHVSFRPLSYRMNQEDHLRIYFGKAFPLPYLDVRVLSLKARDLTLYQLRTLRLSFEETHIYVYFSALKQEEAPSTQLVMCS